MIKQIRPLFLLLLFLSLNSFTQASEITSVNPSGNISINQIIQLVKTQNLDLKATLKELKAKSFLVNQASVLPNPEIELESENIFGSGGNKGFDNAETTAKVGTVIELGGKRHLRIEAAKLKQELSKLNYLSVLSQLIIQSNQLGFEVLKQQRLIELDEERLKTNKAFFKEIKQRVQKGRLNIVEQKRASILVSQTKLSIKKRKQELNNAKNQLSLIWGYSKSQFDSLEGDIQVIDELPSLTSLQAQLKNYIELQVKSLKFELAKVEVEVEKSLGSQDLSIAGGIKHENSSNDKSYVLSAGLPIAIFDRNTGAINSSKMNVRQKKLERESALIKSQNRLERLYGQIELLKGEIDSLKLDFIPQSKEVFKTIQEGYLKGKFSYLEVLESQNTLFEFNENYIGTLTQYHNLFQEIKSLTGANLEGEDHETTIN